MPRSARVHVPGGLYHIISRCLNHEHLLAGTEERARYLELVAQSLGRTDAQVHAWCIMGNHVHLALMAGEEPLWRFLKRVNSGYATWKNRKEKRLGPVFAQRYRAILVERDAYLLELVRYIHLNPVRAGVVVAPDASDWSSHRHYLGLDPAPEWLHTELVMEHFGERTRVAREAFRRFVLEALGAERSPILSGDEWEAAARDIARTFNTEVPVSGPILGSEAFVEEVLSAATGPAGRLRLPTHEAWAADRPPIDRLIDVVCTTLDLDRVEFDECPKRCRPRLARQLLVRTWVQVYGRTQSDLARHLKVPNALVSRWYGRAMERADRQHNDFEAVVEALPEGIHYGLRGERVRQAPAAPRITVNVELVDD